MYVCVRLYVCRYVKTQRCPCCIRIFVYIHITDISLCLSRSQRAASRLRSDPEEVVREVEELVAFEKRWLTDAIVNSDARGVYEVSFRAISKLQILVAASDPDDTFAKVICLY
jgi:hypothetical protein